MSLKASYCRVPPPVFTKTGIAAKVAPLSAAAVKSSLSSFTVVVAATCWLSVRTVLTGPIGLPTFNEVIVRVSSWICVGDGKLPGALRLEIFTTPVRTSPTRVCGRLVCGDA